MRVFFLKYSFCNQVMESYKVNDFYYQVPYSIFFKTYPIMKEIYDGFVDICESADTEFMSEYYNSNVLNQTNYKIWKSELFNVPNFEKYRLIEKGTNIGYFDDLPNWYTIHAMFKHEIYKYGKCFCYPEFHPDENLLKRVAKSKINARGLFFYPKNSFREWHTNENDLPGMRYYLIYSDKYDSGMNFLIDNEVVTVYDKPNHVNIFYVSNTKPLWHNVFSNCNRFSLGLNL